MFLHRVRGFRSTFRLLATLAAAPLFFGFAAERALAQAPGIMVPGDTIVTGFSGVLPPNPPIPSGNPVDETFINLDGASMQIQRPSPAGPPAGQLIPSPTVFSALARSVGQVFPIALDDAQVPNIYLGATSAFGIQIVTPDSDGDGRPERVTTGQAGAEFMQGQWGATGAPGSIYKVDGTTGAITLFTSIGANGGPGIGDIVYDRASRQFFASDLDTGLIYRLDWTGTIVDTFDHGVDGRPSHGLPAVADDGSAMDITDPSFNSEDPATWGYTPKERMVWGMAMHNGRLYYAAADGPQIWSVGINLDGTFAGDVRWEVDVAGLASANPVSDIIFDNQGRMILAQRGEQRGSYDYSVFAEPLLSSVVRYRREIPDDPTTPSVWIEIADEYAIGMRPEGHNATGGVALGYDYDAFGRMHTGSCSQFLWSTGESLRDNPELALQLSTGGPAIVHGLQGNDKELVRPANDPPFSSYFTDYDSTFDDPENQGHIGDVEIWQPCFGYTPPYFPPPPPPPPGTFNLTIDKQGFPCVQAQDSYFCGFTIRVKNTGTTPYWGPITVDDWLPSVPPGAIMTFFPQPPWVCGAVGPADYQCTYPPVFLLPGDGVDLYVIVKLPQSYKPCSVENAARIVWPFGWGDANPADDFDWASAQIPGKRCEPPKNPKTNLKIQKSAYTKVCSDVGSDWVCWFLVQVTNTGPGIFSGPIEVTETLSSGTLVASGPWVCAPPGGPVYTCTYPPTVINPFNSVFMWVKATVPKAVQQRLGKCSIINEAKITKPLGDPQNTSAGDDSAPAVEALTPGENCEPLGGTTDLSIKKTAYGCISYTPEGPTARTLIAVPPSQKQWRCYFGVTVKNDGLNPFFAPIQLRDTFTPAPLAPSPYFWAPYLPAPGCVLDGADYKCTTPGSIFLPPGGSLPPLVVVAVVPDDGQTCQIKNTAKIASPLGPNSNTNPLNDSSPATAFIESPRCHPVELLKKEELCPFLQKMPGGGCCPEGEPWNGKSCGNAPPPLPPPDNSCPPDRQKANGGCCQVGTKYNLRSGKCDSPPINTCPQNRRIPGGGCCGAGTTFNLLTGKCVAPPSNDCPQSRRIPGGGCCDRGTIFNLLTGQCSSINTCPRDQQMPNGDCCPSGSKYDPRQNECVKPPSNDCPKDRQIPGDGCCKQGTKFINGTCINIGIVPINPDVTPLPACPLDSDRVGTRCRCKPGTFGNAGNCQKNPSTNGGGITTLPQNNTIQLPACPPGTVGKWPICLPPNQDQQIK